jgi:hypothetical protein|tara:strand:+ start:11469 stop:13073 length:1605 start_codon:yes stop_codon:yes gene_type:complete
VREYTFLIFPFLLLIFSCSSDPSGSEEEKEPDSYTILTDIDPQGIGSIEISPNQLTFEEGSSVEITAIPNDGWSFVQWRGSVDDTINPLTVMLTDNIDLTASFNSLSFATHGGEEAELTEGLTVTSDGGYAVTGYTSSTTGFAASNNLNTGVFVIKYTDNLEVEWAKIFGGSENDISRDIIATQDGGLLVLGEAFSNDGDFSASGFNKGSIFLMKLSSTGNIQWVKKYGGNEYDQPRKIIEDKDGNFVFTGTSHSVDGDFEGLYTESQIPSDIFIMKTDPLGNLIWVKTYGGTSSDFGNAISTNSQGDYFITGKYSSNDQTFEGLFTGSNSADHSFIIKTDNSGDFVWVATLNGFDGSDNIEGLTTYGLSDGGVLISGSTNSTKKDFTGFTVTNSAAFVAKFDGMGNLSWLKVFNGSGFDYGESIIETNDNEILLTGRTNSKDGDFSSASGESYDIYLLSLSSSGVLNWIQTFSAEGVDEAYNLQVTSNGNIIIGGTTDSSEGIFTATRTSVNETGPTSFVLKLNSDGNLLKDD